MSKQTYAHRLGAFKPARSLTWFGDAESEPARSGRCTSVWTSLTAEHEVHGEALAPDYLVHDGALDVFNALEDSRALLELQENWDGAGAKPYDRATWARAAEFLHSHSDAATRVFGIPLPRARVGPASDGSIDIYWQLTDRRMLVNVPAGSEEFSFATRKPNGATADGTIIPGEIRHDLLAWLLLP